MDKNTKFPVYKQNKDCIYAFVAMDKMFKIEMIGSNKNPGCTIDHYITRKMVLKHWPHSGHVISEKKFCELYDALFASIKNKIINF